jgi:hypothetical protein
MRVKGKQKARRAALVDPWESGRRELPAINGRKESSKEFAVS